MAGHLKRSQSGTALLILGTRLGYGPGNLAHVTWQFVAHNR